MVKTRRHSALPRIEQVPRLSQRHLHRLGQPVHIHPGRPLQLRVPGQQPRRLQVRGRGGRVLQPEHRVRVLHGQVLPVEAAPQHLVRLRPVRRDGLRHCLAHHGRCSEGGRHSRRVGEHGRELLFFCKREEAKKKIGPTFASAMFPSLLLPSPRDATDGDGFKKIFLLSVFNQARTWFRQKKHAFEAIST